MFDKIKNDRHLIRSIFISVAVGLLIFIASKESWVRSLDYRITDVLYTKWDKSNATLPITVIGIDEPTLQAKGSFIDWDRSIYAELIDALMKDGNKPAVIAFDILFTGEKTAEGDAAFVDAAKRHGNVIAGMFLDLDSSFVTDENGDSSIDHSHIKSITYPFAALNEVTRKGFTNTSLDSDGVMRRAFVGKSYDGSTIGSLGYVIYNEYMKTQDEEPLDLSYYIDKNPYFLYTEDPRSVRYVSMIDILNGTRDVSEFDNEIVIVGAYAEGFQDDFTTAVDRRNDMYGVAIHANIARALSGELLYMDPSVIQSVVFGLGAAIITFVLFYVSLPIGAAISGAVIGADIGISQLCHMFGYNPQLLYIIVAIFLVYIVMVIIQYVSTNKEKAKIRDAFKMYVSPQVVDEVSKSGTYELKLGGQTKDISCLFIDIRGFTTMSEGLDPETVVGILNEYFAVITDAIFKNGGTLDKFIGDAAMAVFNSPFDLDDYEMRSIRSAIDIATQSEKLKAKLLEQFGRTINYGIGINCGPATIGNIGCDFRMDFTAIGDTVNTASRLESNAKAGQILISEALYNRVKDHVIVEDVGDLSLKGKANVIHTFNVKGVK